MTAQKGKDLLLKVDSDGVGTFVTVGGLRARSLAFNAAKVDATDQESAGRWALRSGSDRGHGCIKMIGAGPRGPAPDPNRQKRLPLTKVDNRSPLSLGCLRAGSPKATARKFSGLRRRSRQ